MATDWPVIIFQPRWMQRLDQLALRRFSQPGLAEEASGYVIEQLSLDDWAACKQYSGRAKPETYLLTLCHNLLEEFSRKRFGRPRPPEWLKREGDLWVRVWKMVCMERQLLPSVTDQLSLAGQRSTDTIVQIARVIKARLPWCGSSAREIPTDCLCHSDDEDSTEFEQTDASTEQKLNHQQLEESLTLINQWLLLPDSPSNKATDINNHIKDRPTLASPEQWQQLRYSLALTSEERLLLKLVYQEGLKLNAVARALNMPSYQPGRLLKALHTRIRQALVDADINFTNNTFEEAGFNV